MTDITEIENRMNAAFRRNENPCNVLIDVWRHWTSPREDLVKLLEKSARVRAFVRIYGARTRIIDRNATFAKFYRLNSSSHVWRSGEGHTHRGWRPLVEEL